MAKDKEDNNNFTDEIKDLNPEDRIRRIKELEEKIKRQLTSLRELSEQTQHEIKENKEREFLKIAPEQENIRIEDLFTEEGNLENQVKKENNKLNIENNQPTYLMQKLGESKQAIGNLLNETYTIRTFVNETVSKYNPNLGNRLNKQLFALANELKNLYEHNINE